MGIGMVIADLEKSLISDCANGILQGIAGGTFLYITFFEVLPHELNSPGNRMPKLLFVLSGFSCICGLLFLTH
jgi:zinc transporter 1/2/3